MNSYWAEKETKKREAHEHTFAMSKRYACEIETCANASIIYSNENVSRPDGFGSQPKVTVLATDSVSAVFTTDYMNERTHIGVLNFASYKEPGGMFLAGSKAQEECLCHESYLYNVLSSKQLTPYYVWNNEHKNRAMYLNRAIWSPNVRFLRSGEFAFCDVITCAAPNITTGKKYCNVSDEENKDILFDRMRFILDICAEQKIEIPILGAFGCGVFGQDAETVATIWKTLLESGNYDFKEVVFAVIPGPNLDAFQRVFH